MGMANGFVPKDPVRELMKRMQREKAREVADRLDKKGNPVASAAAKLIRAKAEMDEISEHIIKY